MPVQQPSRADEELQVEEQDNISDDQERKAAEKELEHEEQFAEEEEIIEEDIAKEESNFNSEWPVKEPEKEIQPPSEELDDEIEENVAEERQVMDIREEKLNKTLEEAHLVTNEFEQTVVDEIQTMLVDSDHETDETGKIMDEKLKVPETNIHPEKGKMITSELEKQREVPASEESQTSLGNLHTNTSAIEDVAVEKQEKSTPAQEMQTDSEETDVLTNIIEDGFSEEHTEHAVEEIRTVSSEILTAEMKTSEDGDAEQVSKTAKEEIQTPLDTNGNVDNQIKDALLAENEQEAVKSDKKSLISEKSVEGDV